MSVRIDPGDAVRVANKLIKSCKRLTDGEVGGDSAIIVSRRFAEAFQLAEQLRQHMNPSGSQPGELREILDTQQSESIKIGLASLRERLDRLMPTIAKSTCFQYRQWTSLVSPLEELRVALEETDQVARDSQSGTEIPRRVLLAYSAYQHAIKKLDDQAKDREVYEWLLQYGFDEYELPAFETWARYVREARKLYQTQKNLPRASRASRSIVKASEC